MADIVVGSASIDIFTEVFNRLYGEWQQLARATDESGTGAEALREKYLGRMVGLQDGRQGTVRAVEEDGALLIEVEQGKLVRLRTRAAPPATAASARL